MCAAISSGELAEATCGTPQREPSLTHAAPFPQASVEMVKCVTLHWGDAEASAAGGCEQNPFLTPYPYLFITISPINSSPVLTFSSSSLRTNSARPPSARSSRGLWRIGKDL